ncbi:MAG TPA: 50S ribosomal protein L31 [Candidatus Sulfotelmatobacter sp.]|jgi:large subunit ribosomal protein L31|nr:50S ribosomal protein L31 [Candidatus Sulfotelmatobacter sp.]
MKANAHPTYYADAQAVCVCGNKFTVGSTKQIIHVELCYKCHPFYTGEQRFVDTASRIQKFQTKQQKANDYKKVVTKKVEEKKRQQEGPKSLREMLMGVK